MGYLLLFAQYHLAVEKCGGISYNITNVEYLAIFYAGILDYDQHFLQFRKQHN